jgi:hypothetical protein
MNRQDIILFLVPIASLFAISGALHLLAVAPSLFSFVILCAVQFGVIATVWHVVDPIG